MSEVLFPILISVEVLDGCFVGDAGALTGEERFGGWSLCGENKFDWLKDLSGDMREESDDWLPLSLSWLLLLVD